MRWARTEPPRQRGNSEVVRRRTHTQDPAAWPYKLQPQRLLTPSIAPVDRLHHAACQRDAGDAASRHGIPFLSQLGSFGIGQQMAFSGPAIFFWDSGCQAPTAFGPFFQPTRPDHTETLFWRAGLLGASVSHSAWRCVPLARGDERARVLTPADRASRALACVASPVHRLLLFCCRPHPWK